jgi:hypothetical protein
MQLTDRAIGLLNVQSNYAHELGHAWGLWHEHQNPNFWKGVDAAQDGEVFGPDNNNNWNCANLIDYASFASSTQQFQQAYGNRLVDIDTLCKSAALAGAKGFSAAEYLPLAIGAGIPGNNGKGSDSVDWTSIMICESLDSLGVCILLTQLVVDPSGAGGTGTAAPPPGADNRAPILLKPDGTRIPINLYPSQQDITALRALYGSEPAAAAAVLLQKAGGSKTKKFLSMFTKSTVPKKSGCL